MSTVENHSERWWVKLFDRLNTLAYQELFFMWLGGMVFFALVYFALSYVTGNGPAPLAGDIVDRLLNALYYSVITATNTGYGDITPYGLSRFFAALESVTGLFIFAVFVAKLMSHRQDVALKEIHKLTFENTFHNIRESLHIARKDFDLAATHSASKKGLTDDDYHRLAVAYEQCTNAIHELPSFYSTATGLYHIDARREELILEAVHRTVLRALELLETLSKNRVPWILNEESMARLRELLNIIESCVHEWQKRSAHNHSESFEEIFNLNDRIKAEIKSQLSFDADKRG